ncbi:bifunctional hydroxymethylpyrimidine kinase/phosphomethylpyrimidine kinase [Photobacterium angustum]|uniref:hydroxymethylpyrimidine kinase n=1 Tax=Photobacterium angustum TaxID=661 RepID=A0A2S7VZ68_PHOAN|nr:bifunctional hydroxymethylpyrimidine kinase/phosphomethylpyrimidine kinase [Photobacterium angustum]PQJ67128.1 bifunctional hydroxymethylpyrimidine kinase/phosphomethylpyrimidine kinase [Photobacterium angustum]
MSSKTRNKSHVTPPIVLTIAGSDSSGGAGIQADIKAISATGGYACSVITAITAQNTQGVSGILPIPLTMIEQQLDAVFTDLNIQAVKIGMLADSDIITLVANKIKEYKPRYLVIDPVMVATSGDLLLQESAISTLKQKLLPLADLITPNLPEAAALTNSEIPQNLTDMLGLVSKLRDIQTKAILLKGGHLENDSESNDLLILNDNIIELKTKRIETQNTHGTGCTLSSAIASYLAQGYPIEQATQRGKEYITSAISAADLLNIGSGHGPVNHFFTQD